MVLKGSFGLSPSGRKLRTALISFQYIISVGLIVGACIVQLQDRYMRHFKLGFDKDKIAIVELSDSIYRGHKDAYVNQLLKYPEVESVAFSMSPLIIRLSPCIGQSTRPPASRRNRAKPVLESSSTSADSR